MKQVAYLLTAIVLVVLDSIYLYLINPYFNYQINLVQQADIKMDFTAAILCYVFLIFGLNYFIIGQHKTAMDAFLLGLTIYAVYELTNKALLKKWSWFTVLIDTLWGGILFSLTTLVVYKFNRWL